MRRDLVVFGETNASLAAGDVSPDNPQHDDQLPPIEDSRSEVLILGTFPGPESLRLQEYYGDWRNKFWKVMGVAFGINPEANYENRKPQLLRHRCSSDACPNTQKPREHRPHPLDFVARQSE